MLTPTAATATAHEIAKKVFENIGKGAGEITACVRAARTGAACHTAIKRRMTKTIISRFFIGIFQNFVGFIRFFELRFRIRIVRIAVGVQFFRLLTIGFLDFFRRSATRHTQNIVIIALRHR